MRELAQLARAEALVLLVSILLTTLFQLLSQRIRTTGLLKDKARGEFDPARLQMLVASVLLAGLLLTRLDQMRASMTVALPSGKLLLGLGGSQALYLARTFLQQRRPI